MSRERGAGSGDDGRPEAGTTWWRPLATVAVFSILPFAGFLNENRREIGFDGTLASYALFLLIPGLTIVAAAWTRRGPAAAERAAVLFAVGSFVFFKFQPIQDLADSIGSPGGWWTVAAWAAVMAAALFVAVRLSGHRAMWTYALVAGMLITAAPIVQYVNYRATGEGSAKAQTTDSLTLPSKPARPGRPPDVYFFLLDGYGRQDQFRKLVDFDNAPFLGELRKRGFDVADRALTPYNMTIVAVPSLFGMDYRLTRGKVGQYGPYYKTITGANPVVEGFKRLGYDFAFATDWPAPGFIKCTDHMDICIRPEETLGDREWALLGTTPGEVVLPKLGVSRDDLARKDSVLRPEDAVRQISEQRSDRPLFVYTHLLQPHAPYLYTEDCGVRELTSASAWGEVLDGRDAWGLADGAGGDGYETSVRCINQGLLRATDEILERNRDAVIIFVGDHGPAFGFDMTEPPSEWSQEDIEMRYSILSAARFPDCSKARAADNLVNVFRVTLSCIGNEELRPLPYRRFADQLGQDEHVEPLPQGR